HDDELQDEGMEDVGDQEVVGVVTTAKMLIDIVVDAVQVATAIADVPKKDQILFDEEVARKLQEDIYEKERIIGERARQEEEANNALTKTWEDIQAKVSTKKDEAETVHESSSKRARDKLDKKDLRSKK
nr:hypothetical protein [Tanacetum cinerariifolium]